MKKITKADVLVAAYPEEDIVQFDGFDVAIIGIDPKSMRVIYSKSKIIIALIDQGMEEDDAEEFFDYNIDGAYIGERTPIICDDWGMQ